MTAKRFAKSADAKKAGWHSKRHETRVAQDAAREAYQAKSGKKARQRRALERLSAAAEHMGPAGADYARAAVENWGPDVEAAKRELGPSI